MANDEELVDRVEQHFSEKPSMQTASWIAFIDLACDERVDVSDVHPILAEVANKVMLLRLALRTRCEDDDQVEEVMEVCRRVMEQG